jgi:hypothetical protein
VGLPVIGIFFTGDFTTLTAFVLPAGELVIVKTTVASVVDAPTPRHLLFSAVPVALSRLENAAVLALGNVLGVISRMHVLAYVLAHDWQLGLLKNSLLHDEGRVGDVFVVVVGDSSSRGGLFGGASGRLAAGVDEGPRARARVNLARRARQSGAGHVLASFSAAARLGVELLRVPLRAQDHV